MSATEPFATVPGAVDLFATVVPGGFCIGCGNCAAASGGTVGMAMNDEGFVQATSQGAGSDPTATLSGLCPFSNNVPNESEIARALPWDGAAEDVRVGRYAGLWAGHVDDEVFRHAGGSGGMTTWFLQELLSSGEVDYVLHVKPVDRTTDPQGRLFRYALSATAAELKAGRKSRYYPVDLAEAYEIIRSRPGRYAVVGVPCFAKAIRLMQRSSPEIADRVRWVVGLVCGHQKSAEFAEYLGWIQGVRPEELRGIDFRVKLPGGDATEYTSAVTDEHETRIGRPLKEYFGTTWDLGFMKYGACEFCDDVYAETADIVFGDAWLEPFQQSWLGANVVLTRHPVATRLVQAGIDRGELALETITLEQMVQTQASGLRHRREGLTHRLAQLDGEGRWRPRKRFETPVPISDQRRQVYDLRLKMGALTARAFARSRRGPSVWLFQARVSPAVFRYHVAAIGWKRGLTQSAPFKWLRQKLKRG
jgi:coenzyme F420 hydrogenase subunit beta